MDDPIVYAAHFPKRPLFYIHLYEHLFLRSLCQYLASNNFPYITLLGNISAQTFNGLILLSIECGDSAANSTIGHFLQHSDELLDISADAIKAEIDRISAEDGYRYDVRDWVALQDSLLSMSKARFKLLATGGLLEYARPTVPIASSNIDSRFSPDSFRDITINLAIDQPTVIDRIMLQASSDLLAEVVDDAVRTLGGYRHSNAEVADCGDGSVLIKIEALMSGSVSDKELISVAKRQLTNCASTISEEQVNAYFTKVGYSGQYFLRMYNELGVCPSLAQNRKITGYRNLITLLRKIDIYDIVDWPTSDYYNELPGDRLER